MYVLLFWKLGPRNESDYGVLLHSHIATYQGQHKKHLKLDTWQNKQLNIRRMTLGE